MHHLLQVRGMCLWVMGGGVRAFMCVCACVHIGVGEGIKGCGEGERERDREFIKGSCS